MSICIPIQLSTAAAYGLAGLAALAWLTACTREPIVARQSAPQISVGGVVADRSMASKNWFDSQVSVAGPLDLVSYKAEYVIEGGEVLSHLGDVGTAPPLTRPPVQLGGDAFRQTLATRLPSIVGGRPEFNFSSVTGTRWNAEGGSLRREQQAQLSWNPAAVNLQLEWAAPRAVSDPAKPLDCGLGGNLRLGLGRFVGIGNQSLLLGARTCNVDAPARIGSAMGVDSWSGAWQFGRPALSNKLAFTVLETAPAQSSAQQAAASGYEVRFSQTRAQGRWIGDSAVGYRRVADVAGPDAAGWTAQASIKREIYAVAVTAGWQRDADPLWFVPGVARPLDQVSVGVDMRTWLTQRLGIGDLINAKLSYQWNESADPAVNGGAVYWNLSKTW